MLKPNPKTAARKHTFQTIAVIRSHFVTDSQCGVTSPQPWRVLKGATGFFGMQIDTRPGLMLTPQVQAEVSE